MHPLRSFLVLTGLGSVALGAASEPTREQTEFFESKIRPILAGHCYKCHSLAEGKAKGGLTLDTRAGLQKGGDEGKVIDSAQPEKSRLLIAVGYLDPDLQMPPKGEKLSDAQIAALTQWVKMGAPDPRKDSAETRAKLTGLTDSARHHWAYQPVKKPAVPTTKNSGWVRTPVDSFILAKLEERKMVPAPDAAREALLRRATYDLIGLPPTVEEVEAFLRDTSPDAFAKVVDRLLASPHYGERWGRFWLDTARYSDTAGGQAKKLKGEDYRYAYAWTYRDWVVEAMNRDLPYDQFITQQLAADLLPNNPTENLAALGLLTVGERFPKRDDIINDRIDTVTKGFLGLTVACARCHDHMFDPIPTRDYYALHGVFASTIEPEVKTLVEMPTQGMASDYRARMTALEEANRRIYYEVMNRIQRELFGKIDGYLLVSTLGNGKRGGTEEQLRKRNALMSGHDLERDYVAMLSKGKYSNKAKIAKKKGEMVASMKETSTHGSLTAVFGPFREFAAIPATAFAEKAPALSAEIAKRSGVNPLVAAAFASAKPASLEDVARLYKQFFERLEPRRKEFLQAHAKSNDGTVSGFSDAELQIFHTPLEVLTAKQADTPTLRDFAQQLPTKISYRTGFQFPKINELEMTHPAAPGYAMQVADSPQPKNSPIFIRGQSEVRGEIVPRAFLEVLSPDRKPLPFQHGSGRYELAQCIAAKTNPLTARVMVNRVWMHHFGEGFVRTPDDLGTMSEPPSHPELLDYLATTFMDHGWSLKKLHRLIMLSRVYQQSTRTQPEFATIDPENRLLWRANIRRLDFEAMRDSLLVFSGQLDESIGGKPINLTDEPYSYRRSVYGYIDRGNLPDLLQNFDFSDPDMPNSRRASTVVPQQALFFMNSSMAVDVTRKIVARPEVAGATDGLARLMGVYRIIFQRDPSPQEVQLASQFIATEAKTELGPLGSATVDGVRKAMSAEALAAQKLTAASAAKLAKQAKKAKKENTRKSAADPIHNEGERVERKPLTAWETYVQALLFSNEAAYVN